MKNNKIIALLALALMLAPVLKLQAEETRTSAGGSTSVSSSDDDKYPLPPVINPNIKPSVSSSSSTDTRGEVELGDDKGGLRTESDSSTSIQTSAESRAKTDEKIEARKKDILNKMLGIKGEIKIKLEAKSQERIKKLLSNMFNMLNNQIDRLTKVDARIGAKITILKAEGTDVTAIMAQYTVAQTALAKAKIDVAATNGLSIDQTSIATSKDTIRSLVRTAEDSIKDAGKEYMKIIQMLPERSDSTKVETNSSSSTSVNQ